MRERQRLAVWCRTSAVVALHAQDHPALLAKTAPVRQTEPSRRGRVRRALRTTVVKICLGTASLFLAAASVLLRVGVLRPKAAAMAFRYVLRLADLTMRLWRRGRSCGRA